MHIHETCLVSLTLKWQSVPKFISTFLAPPLKTPHPTDTNSHLTFISSALITTL